MGLPLLPPFTKLDRILESLFIHCKEPIKYTSNRFTFSGMKKERKKRERGRKIHCLFYVSVLFHCKMIHSLQRTDQIYIKSIHIFSVSFRHPNDLKYGHSGLDVNGYGYLQQPLRLTTHQLATKTPSTSSTSSISKAFARTTWKIKTKLTFTKRREDDDQQTINKQAINKRTIKQTKQT